MNEKGRILTKFIFLYIGIPLCLMLYPDRVTSGPYLDSAHGNSTYGVKRIPIDYSRGNCAHCHEQHASIGGAEPVPNNPAGPDYYTLFMDLWINPPQSNLFCYGCHTLEAATCGTGGTCQSNWQRTNYCYSRTRGGDSSLNCPNSVYLSFQFVDNAGISQPNCGSSVGSSHLIQDIGSFMAGKAGFPGTLAYLNPCSACHNPHRAKRDYPCSRPVAHANLLTWNVWGDDAGTSERMDVGSANRYWAPLRIGGGYEPDGSTTQDGSNMPNYMLVCVDCHNTTNTIYSNRLSRNLYTINWTASGDFHGNNPRNDSSQTPEWGDLLLPYKTVAGYPKTNYLLNCTDCHEPHGSPNEFLLRITVNGTQVNTINANGRWFYWCQTCHVLTINNPMHTDPNFNCYSSGACHRHTVGAGGTLF